MKKTSLRSLAISVSISLGAVLALDMSLLTPAAEAGCRPTGRYVNGMAVLTCSGRSRCRPTGYRRIRGRVYRIMSCPR
jgi:hypothetical protein